MLRKPRPEPGWARLRRAAVLAIALVVVMSGTLTIVGQIVRWAAARPASVAAPLGDGAFTAVAVPFAADYLSWDEARRTARQTALARPAAADIEIDGWGGSGRQWAESPTPIGIARADPDHAVVTVRVRVTPMAATPASTGPTTPPTPASSSVGTPASTTPATPPPAMPTDDGPNVASGSPPGVGATAAPPRWVNLAVPLHRSGAQIVVSGMPALVGTPQPTAAPPAVGGPAVAEDAAFAGQTREVIATLVRAYGSGDLAYARASGTSFTGLDGAASVQEITGWRVANQHEAGSARIGDVTVVWVLSGGAGTLRCTYRVELRGDGGRWYLASIGAATGTVS